MEIPFEARLMELWEACPTFGEAFATWAEEVGALAELRGVLAKYDVDALDAARVAFVDYLGVCGRGGNVTTVRAEMKRLLAPFPAGGLTMRQTAAFCGVALRDVAFAWCGGRIEDAAGICDIEDALVGGALADMTQGEMLAKCGKPNAFGTLRKLARLHDIDLRTFDKRRSGTTAAV